MDTTWIKLYRKLLDSDIFKNEKLLKIWIWILLRANHKDNSFLLGRQKINLKSGQFVMGLNKSSEMLNLAKSTIHYWVDYLEKIGKVELKKTNKYTVITIKNWKEYQGVELQKNSKKTLKKTNKNDKECKELNNSDESPKLKPIKSLYDQLGIKQSIKKVERWQDEASNMIKEMNIPEDKISSVFKCFRDNPEISRFALRDCKELGKMNVFYFFKIYNEEIKKFKK